MVEASAATDKRKSSLEDSLFALNVKQSSEWHVCIADGWYRQVNYDRSGVSR